MSKLKNISAILILLLPIAIISNQVVADEKHMDDANDLFSIYNEAKIDDYNVLQQEYINTLNQLEKAEAEAKLNEVHNGLIDAAIEWQTQEKNKISKEIKELSKQNIEISKQISDEFESDWYELVKLDKLYKMNLSKMDKLLRDYDKFSLTEKRMTDYDTLDELSKEVDELQKTYKEASNVKILGDVYTVVYPLAKETKMTSGFGNRIDPITGASISFHSGIDLRASVGTEVLSLFNGKIIDTGFTATGGNYVSIDHGNGIRSYYCHLSEILCEKGQVVNQYDVIALSGNTGSRTTGPHLHLALYINGNAVNPEILFNEV